MRLARGKCRTRVFAALRRDYAELRASWGGYAGYDNFFAADLNNAKLVSLALYTDLVPAFEALLASQDRDLPQFYRSVGGLAALDKAARHEALGQLLHSGNDHRRAPGAISLGATAAQ
ncbi:MAG: aminopeptidase [Candidatus Accumulibacter sp.]|nr:aminopeptidase [Accumulibacter sp.]